MKDGNCLVASASVAVNSSRLGGESCDICRVRDVIVAKLNGCVVDKIKQLG